MYADARLPFVAAGSPNNSSTSNPSNYNSDSRGMWGRQGYVMQPPPSYNADRPPSRGNNNTNTNMGSPPQYHQPPPPQRGTDYKEMNAGKANVRWFNSPNNNNNNNNTMLGVQPPMPYNPNLNHSPYTVSSPYNNNNNNNNNYNNNNNKSITGYPFSNTTPYPKYNNDNHTAVYGDGPAVRTNFYPTPSRYFPNEVNEHRSGGQWEEGVKLFVGQVPGVCTEAQLIPIFEPYGELLEVRIMRERDTHRSKGSAWVRYHTREAATAAIQALHEKYVIPPQTNPIRVQFALEKQKPQPYFPPNQTINNNNNHNNNNMNQRNPNMEYSGGNTILIPNQSYGQQQPLYVYPSAMYYTGEPSRRPYPENGAPAGNLPWANLPPSGFQ